MSALAHSGRAAVKHRVHLAQEINVLVGEEKKQLAKPEILCYKQPKIHCQEHNRAGLWSLCLGCLLVEAAAGNLCTDHSQVAVARAWEVFFGCQQMLVTLEVCSIGGQQDVVEDVCSC